MSDEFPESLLKEPVPDATVADFLRLYDDMRSKAMSLLSDLNYDGDGDGVFDSRMDVIRGLVDCERCEECGSWFLQREEVKCRLCEFQGCPQCILDGKCAHETQCRETQESNKKYQKESDEA